MNIAQFQHKIKVMIVDDSFVIRSILRKIITQDQDIEIVGSYPSAEQLLIALETIPVDILLLDIEMPNMNGIEAIPHI